ncbi:MAG: ABC transporter substrate-binding protein [Chloroflexi bacterium]|nr:ABC transporter substrate-binding protein [Chloroflexota bacterium]
MSEPRIHPLALTAVDKLQRGRINRREFLRYTTLLGVSVGTAYALAGCAPAAAPASVGAPAAAGGITRGGTLRKGMLIQQIDHPARLSWVEGSNAIRLVNEYLTETGPDNITRPSLLESWEASDDVKTWTLKLRQGIKFNNGDDLTADDVLYSFSQWLDPEVGSSMLGLLSYLDGMNSVEKVDDYTIRLNLASANIGVPEHLFHYPAAILHRDFQGDWVKQPIGTGAFTLVEYLEGERASFKARTDYWQMGEDGSPLPYLDEIVFVSVDKDASVAAIQGGQLDTLFKPRPSDFLALKDNPDLQIQGVATANCFVVRMRVDQEPWNDNRVRTALKMCQDRQKILDLSYNGEGVLSLDAHFSPVHPAYAERPIPAYDPEGALALLEEYAAEKGIQLPLQVTLSTKNDLSEPEIAQTLRESAAAGGFDITLDITEPNGYWDRWTEVPLGITIWAHRSLDTMVPPLAYIADADGNPVPWNETRWVDAEFSEKLRQAELTLDIEARREIIGELEDIMQERGPIGNSYWTNEWEIIRKEFQNVIAHPANFDFYYSVWKQQ